MCVRVCVGGEEALRRIKQGPCALRGLAPAGVYEGEASAFTVTVTGPNVEGVGRSSCYAPG